MADALIVFGAALRGALVGGAASAVGSWAVTRWEHVREIRVEIYRHLLPEIIDRRAGRLRVVDPDNYDPILDAARTGRRSDRRWAEQIETDLDTFREAEGAKRKAGTFNSDRGEYDYPADLEADADNAYEKLTSTVRQYDTWLDQKLGP